MIEPLVNRPQAGAVRPKAVAPVLVSAKPAAAPSTTDQGVAQAVSAWTAVAEMAAKPPVDRERVQAIKAAIAEGRFPIYPATIADRLIAFAEGWRPE